MKGVSLNIPLMMVISHIVALFESKAHLVFLLPLVQNKNL